MASTKMIGISDAMLLIGNDLDRQVTVRVALLNQMVGRVYPAIVCDEVKMLRERQAKMNRWGVLYKE